MKAGTVAVLAVRSYDIYIHIYIYIHREREREIGIQSSEELNPRSRRQGTRAGDRHTYMQR